jgi:hypothetical protein
LLGKVRDTAWEQCAVNLSEYNFGW